MITDQSTIRHSPVLRRAVYREVVVIDSVNSYEITYLRNKTVSPVGDLVVGLTLGGSSVDLVLQ